MSSEPIVNYVTRYTTDVASSIKERGVAVLEGVLNPDELKAAREGLKDTMKHMTDEFPKFDGKSYEALDLDKPATYPSIYGFNPLHSMLLQHHEIGHAQFIWDIRQNPKVKKVFQDIWKTSHLLVSYDGMSLHLPQPRNKKGYARGYYLGNDWLHVDQSYAKTGFQCVQGFVSLYDINEGDATFEYREGSVELPRGVRKEVRDNRQEGLVPSERAEGVRILLQTPAQTYAVQGWGYGTVGFQASAPRLRALRVSQEGQHKVCGVCVHDAAQSKDKAGPQVHQKAGRDAHDQSRWHACFP